MLARKIVILSLILAFPLQAETLPEQRPQVREATGDDRVPFESPQRLCPDGRAAEASAGVSPGTAG